MIYPDPNKLILTDCDGVLVDWEYGFRSFMFARGFEPIREDAYCLSKMYGIDHGESRRLANEFNQTAAINNLPPLRDAIKYVKKLHEEHGFIFHVITSLSLDRDVWEARKRNLDNLFGKTAITLLTCLDTAAPKNEALEVYRDSGCVWVEDRIDNARLGVELGLNTFLMTHHHNIDRQAVGSQRVNNWKSIYNYITGEYD